MQAKLPPQLYENTIEDMTRGTSGWTVPWAMHVDDQGNLWLNGRYTIHDSPGGTVQMRVSKRKLSAGYAVDISKCADERWQPGSAYVGGSNSVPVTKLKH
jgi:hypothetical protein